MEYEENTGYAGYQSVVEFKILVFALLESLYCSSARFREVVTLMTRFQR